MQKLIEIKKDETILVSSHAESFLKPDFVYIPIHKGEQILVHPNDKVQIGDEILKSKEEKVFSPVSGIVRKAVKYHSLKAVDYYLEIENDFEERRKRENQHKNKIFKEDIISYFEGILDKKNIVLNAIDDDVYVLTENFYLFLHYEELLELLDLLEQLLDFESIYVCVKARSSENINKLMSDLGMYPNIILKVVPDLYLLGNSSFLCSYLDLKEEETLVIKAQQFYYAYNYLIRGRTRSDILLTISGNAVEKPIVVQVKIGTLLEDVLREFSVLTEKDVCYFANGLMRGREITPDFFVITEELNSVLIMKRVPSQIMQKCINCGLCYELCPVGIHPYYLRDPKYLEKVRKKCINCGLCSYICPVYVPFYQYLRGDKDE